MQKVGIFACLLVLCSGRLLAQKPSVSSVAESLKSLMQPSDRAGRIKLDSSTVKPYSRIINGGKDSSTLIYRCRYTQAKVLVNAVESIVSSHGSVEASLQQNMLIVNDHPDKIEEIKLAITAMDVSSPQVLVEAKVVEVLVSDGVQRDLSVMWNRVDSRQNLSSSAGAQTSVPNQTAADAGKGSSVDWFPVVAGGIGDSNYSNLNVALQWLLKAEDAKILSAPNVIVSRNATASIVTGTDIPIQTIQVVSGSTTTSTEFKRIGVKLNVTPSLINEDSVSLQVNPQVSNVQRYENITQGTTNYPVPVIAIRNIETELTLKDGQVVMLGGLYTSRDISSAERTPFLSDLPLIGDMFSGKNVEKEVTQLIFFLKISILAQEDLSDGLIYDPGLQAEQIRKMGNIIQRSNDIFPKRIDTTEDKIRGVIRFEDSNGNIEILGDVKTHENPSAGSSELKGDKAFEDAQRGGDSGGDKKKQGTDNKYAF